LAGDIEEVSGLSGEIVGILVDGEFFAENALPLLTHFTKWRLVRNSYLQKKYINIFFPLLCFCILLHPKKYYEKFWF
jgi:hypothetical protein